MTQKLKRAIDLIPLSTGEHAGAKQFRFEELGGQTRAKALELFVQDLEKSNWTGSMHCLLESKQSRSALVLYHGKAVGCLYGSADPALTTSTQDLLKQFLSDLGTPDCQVTLSAMPEPVILGLSALFLGEPLDREDDMDATSYRKHIFNWLAQERRTACLWASLPTTATSCLCFFHEGKLAGSYHVENKTFTDSADLLDELLREDPEAKLQVYLLSSGQDPDDKRFGFTLSDALSRCSI